MRGIGNGLRADIALGVMRAASCKYGRKLSFPQKYPELHFHVMESNFALSRASSLYEYNKRSAWD